MAKHSNCYIDPKAAKRRLRLSLAAFFAALALPVYLLLAKVYAQLENEAYFAQRNQAELFAQRVGQRFEEIIAAEQNRPIAEYSFFNVLENPLLQSPALNLSPLAALPPRSEVPGLTGYFQIDPDGTFRTPALPDLDNGNAAGLSATELQNRIALKNKLQQLLAADNGKRQASLKDGLANASGKEAKANTAMPEKYDYRFAAKLSPAVEEGTASQSEAETSYLSRKKQIVRLPTQSLGEVFERREKTAAPAPAVAAAKQEADAQTEVGNMEATVGQKPVRILSFESEVGPLQLLRLEQGHFCFFRQVWRNNSRYIQGFVFAGGEFFATALQPLLGNAQAAAFSSVMLAYDGELLQQFKLSQLGQEVLLYRTPLPVPLDAVELVVNSGPLAVGSSARVVDLLAVVLVVVLAFGLTGFYRLGAGQIELARRQRNFISAVSHELKTPLTSIRMYAEMLRAGWVVDAAKRQSYYDYILFESERLSRLIANVLQLAKLDNHRTATQLAQTDPRVLLQKLNSKLAAQAEAAGFQLKLLIDDKHAGSFLVAVDEDAFMQIFINLLDNAVKFSADSAPKSVDLGLRLSPRNREAVFFVRDYGPGVERRQMRKIFQLFYRPGDEMTRAKPGTGIGLALVVQLAEQMGAKIDLLNRQPGAEFQIKLPLTLTK